MGVPFSVLGQMETSQQSVGTDYITLTNKFDSKGQVTNVTGRGTVRIDYAFDAQGRRTGMTTYTTAVGGTAANTTWIYEDYRGLLIGKRDNDNKGATYANTAGGRLYQRTWARGANAVYAYNVFGDLYTITYTPSANNVTYLYDRMGRIKSMANGNTTVEYNTDVYGNVTNELQCSIRVKRSFENYYRLSGLGMSISSYTNSFGYDNASRLSTVTADSLVVTYSYLPNSRLINGLEYKYANNTQMNASRDYDNLNRLKKISHLNSIGNGIKVVTNSYNVLNQITNVVNGPDNSYWNYQYDEYGQVTSGKRRWSDSTLVAGQQFEYNFDAMCNRQWTKTGGDATGNNLRQSYYTNNALNQITSRGIPNSVDVWGLAHVAATVSITGKDGVSPAPDGGNTTVHRKDEYWLKTFAVTNNGKALYLTITNSATLTGSRSNEAPIIGNWFVPGNPESFAYDWDGNLTNDGRFSYGWDAENRLTRITSLSTTPNTSCVDVRNTFDALGRRISKTASNYNGSAWVLTTNINFIYDGWNLISILSSDLSPLISFTWATDLSGTRQGVGGVGGLLSMTIPSGTYAGTYYYLYGNTGNIIGLIRATDRTMVAEYEYGPFGELIRATGPLAFVNPFRFSTKYQDDETGLLFYGYRYYNPATGRWLSRDPIEEEGGGNLYAFLANRGGAVDVLGLATYVEDPLPVPNVDQSKIRRNNGMLRKATSWERWWTIREVHFGGNTLGAADALLNHYMDATGTGYALSESEVSQVQATIRIDDIPGFRDLLTKMGNGQKSLLKPVWIPAAALGKGTLGKFYARVGGRVYECSEGYWTFAGEVFYDDLFDFATPGGVPEPSDLPSRKGTPMPYQRTTGLAGADWKVRWAETNIPGCPFWVRSGVLRASAKKGDSTLTIKNQQAIGNGGEWKE